ncbi:hypothetical protein [Acaryochloris marina]|uniref:Uncharacterized protein n=1 Tax=Acaryochloris marina (strain MBIC 11017) TaxID=329726 RepID=B0CB66_ACAM1|nr:hypothetical protein [Acaryochloris marina]ABW26705.1 hypothetical protein AM1_1684 [Acaryochloris marina MBIC11017]
MPPLRLVEPFEHLAVAILAQNSLGSLHWTQQSGKWAIAAQHHTY